MTPEEKYTMLLELFEDVELLVRVEGQQYTLRLDFCFPHAEGAVCSFEATRNGE